MASKHLSEQTTFLRMAPEMGTDFTCGQCGAIFVYERDPAGSGAFEEPRFCPVCGRRNSNAQ